MLTVKLSYPSWWDRDWKGPMFLKETPGCLGVWDDFKFEINNEVEDCDYWIVYDDIDKYLLEKAYCPPKNIIFITGEVTDYWHYPTQFLNQFETVMSARHDLNHHNLHHVRHTCVWHVKKHYDFLQSCPGPSKLKELSTVTSNASSTDGHRLRYALVNKLKGHFKDELSWFGRGEKEIDDKWDALANYKYSIAIENSCHWGYFTEKITDCLLAYTLPLYFGCENIFDFFDRDSLILLDPHDFKKSIRIIEQAIESDEYSKRFNAIEKQRLKILNETAFFPFIVNWLRLNTDHKAGKTKNIIRCKNFYTKNYTLKQNLYNSKTIVSLYFNGYR
jgi:hypothetical protein